MNQELCEVSDFLAGHKKVGRVILITNGTIIPNKKVIDSLRRSNIQVWLDKYGSLSTKADEFYRILTDNNIDVWFDPIHSWLDFGLMTRKYTDKRDIEENFDSCYLRDCCGFYDGKLYRCSRTYVLENNGLEQPGEYECIDINAISNRKDMSRALRKFYGLDYVKACGWCNKKEDRKAIPTGEQL